MKKLITFLFVIILGIAMLVACDTATPEITGAEINEKGELVLTYSDGTTETVKEVEVSKQNELSNATLSFDEYKNLILTYPDGTTVSLGKNALAEYTVKFVDSDGSLIAEEKVLAGLGAEAPASPEREDYLFAGWDKTFNAVLSDMTVTATYTPLPTYTVVFKDSDGNVFKTETVVSGKDATPPADPSKNGYNFTGWDGDYTNITANTVITATYAEKGSYIVTFKDYNGLVLGTDTVKEGGTATPPEIPTRDGYTFKGWSSSLSNVTGHKTVMAQYTLISAQNVFDIAYTVSGDTVTLTLSLEGNVCFAGFEGTLAFEGMTATAVTGDSANVLANLKGDGTISIAYTSATNVTKGETVLTVTLTKTANTGKAILTLADCFNQSFTTVDYKIIGTNLKLG